MTWLGICKPNLKNSISNKLSTLKIIISNKTINEIINFLMVFIILACMIEYQSLKEALINIKRGQIYKDC